jgi:hypothetical protein
MFDSCVLKRAGDAHVRIMKTISMVIFVVFVAVHFAWRGQDDSAVRRSLDYATYEYTDPQKRFKLELPSLWKDIGLSTFTPFAADEDISKTMLQINASAVGRRMLSTEDKEVMLGRIRKMGDRILLEETCTIAGVESWRILGENYSYAEDTRKTHQILLVYRGTMLSFSLTASPAVYPTVNAQFENSLRTLKLL